MTANNSVFEPVLMALVGDLCSQYEKAEIAGRLKPEYFIDPIQHEIFSAIQRLGDAGEEVCPFTIWEGFDPDTELFQQIRAYCLELSDSSTSIANIEPYIDRAIQVGMDGEIGRFIQAELVRINRADLTAVEKRDEIEDALDDSRELFVNQAPELVPTMEQQWKLMSDCVFNPVPDTEFTFKDQIIPKEELTVMPAFNGAGKSFMALQIAICKAIGKNIQMWNLLQYHIPIRQRLSIKY